MAIRRVPLTILLSALTAAALAATPPALVNYQGVLRSSADAPLTGTYDMVFRFFDAPSGGNEILVDWHTSDRPIGPVSVSGGLFSVALGAAVADGSGPGTYGSLADVFRDFGAVWLEVQVGSEVLAPRTRIVASAYALNATNLGGRDPSSFLDTSAAGQVKAGTLAANSGTYSDAAIKGVGVGRGGEFRNTNWGSFALLADQGSGVVGQGFPGGDFYGGGAGAIGVSGQGDSAGVYGVSFNRAGFFENRTLGANGRADLGMPNTGVVGYGTYTGCETCDGGGKFWDVVYTGVAVLADGDVGVLGRGQYAGGAFRHTYDIFGHYDNWAYIAGETYKITGVGSMGFVQNHPFDSGKVIVYNAPEGNEVATYTRGSGRLIHGEARVPLDETFAWTTNPDLGLTVHVTPVGSAASLYVASKSTHDILVRSADGRDVEFDYVVYGLRIGFERTSIVQEKDEEALIPPPDFHEDQYRRHPELARYAADTRFRAIATALGHPAPARLAGAEALRAAIGVVDRNHPREAKGTVLTPASRADFDARSAKGEIAVPSASPVAATAPAIPARAPRAAREPAATAPALDPPRNATFFEISERVEPGDLLALDPSAPGKLRRATTPGDGHVVGIVVGEPGETWVDRAPVAIAGVAVLCKVDATAMPIDAGDLLVASALPGHAMRAEDAPRQGTVIGKALEPLASGAGAIRVLVMSR